MTEYDNRMTPIDRPGKWTCPWLLPHPESLHLAWTRGH